MRNCYEEKESRQYNGCLKQTFLASSAHVKAFVATAKSGAKAGRTALEQYATGEQYGHYDKENIKPQHNVYSHTVSKIAALVNLTKIR